MAAIKLLTLAQAAHQFAQAVTDVAQHREQLNSAYHAWRVSTGVTVLIERDDENWSAMMTATAEDYRLLQNAKGRERRAKAKLVLLANEVDALK